MQAEFTDEYKAKLEQKARESDDLTPVKQELEVIKSLLDHQQHMIDRMTAALSFVIRDDRPGGVAEAPAGPQGESALIRELWGIREQIGANTARLEALMSRVEV